MGRASSSKECGLGEDFELEGPDHWVDVGLMNRPS